MNRLFSRGNHGNTQKFKFSTHYIPFSEFQRYLRANIKLFVAGGQLLPGGCCMNDGVLLLWEMVDGGDVARVWR